MFDDKDMAILNEFRKQKQEKITVAQICKNLSLTKGNFYFHFNHLEKEFKKQNKKLTSELKTNWCEFLQQIQDNKKIFFSQKQRYLLIGLLLTYKKTLKLEEIKNFFWVSTNTAFLDIKNLEKYLLKHQHFQDLTIVNKKDGYFLVGSELAKRKLLINLVIEVVNLQGYELLKSKILEIVKDQENEIQYSEVEKIFDKNFKKLKFIDFEHKTFILIYFILTLKYSKKDFKIEEIISHNNLKIQKFYLVAQEILQELQVLSKNSNFSSGFELTILSLMLSSHTQKVYCQNLDEDLKKIKSKVQKVLKLLQTEGYLFDKELNQELTKYLHWTKHVNINNFIYDHSSSIRKKFIFKKKKYIALYSLVEKYFKENFLFFNIDFWPRQLMEITLKIIKNTKCWPSNQNEKVILISDLKGGWINLYITSINEQWKKYQIVKIINWKFYLENKKKMKNYKKISNDEKIIFENQGVYIPYSIFEE